MVELMVDMWMYLVGAGLLGLVLGWAFRGAFLPRPKAVSVAAPAANDQLAILSAQHRAEQAEANAATLEERVKTAQEAAAQYQAEASSAKAEIAHLQSKLEEAEKASLGAAPLMAAPVSEAAIPVVAPDDQSARQEWQNRYLSSRVRFLEGRLEAAESAPEADAASAPVVSDETSEATSRQAWMNSYYAARVKFLENQMTAEAAAPEALPEAAPIAVPVEAAEPEISEEAFAQAARQKWQLRYLTARVTYLEGQKVSAEPAAEPVIDTAALDAAKSRIAALESSVAQLDAVNAKAAEVEQKLTTLEEERNALAARLSDVEAAARAPLISDADLAKLKWQAKYLKTRTLFLEENADKLSGQPGAPAGEPTAEELQELESLKSEITVLKAELGRISAADNEAEKELARLRWRNRYLEGRLKYLDAATLDAESDADDATDDVAAALAQITRSVDFEQSQSHNVAETYEEDEEELPPVFEIAPRGEQALMPAVVEPVETGTDDLVLEETRPESLDGPHGGVADELTRIGGIGPKIEGILNELGIFHFAQIAAWTPGEAAWIDSYLRFQGRVQREKWTDQAASLMKTESA